MSRKASCLLSNWVFGSVTAVFVWAIFPRSDVRPEVHQSELPVRSSETRLVAVHQRLRYKKERWRDQWQIVHKQEKEQRDKESAWVLLSTSLVSIILTQLPLHCSHDSWHKGVSVHLNVVYCAGNSAVGGILTKVTSPVFTEILSGLLAAVSCSFIWLPCGRTISPGLYTCKCLVGSWLWTLSACAGLQGLQGPGNTGTEYRWVIRPLFKSKCGKH